MLIQIFGWIRFWPTLNNPTKFNVAKFYQNCWLNYALPPINLKLTLNLNKE